MAALMMLTLFPGEMAFAGSANDLPRQKLKNAHFLYGKSIMKRETAVDFDGTTVQRFVYQDNLIVDIDDDNEVKSITHFTSAPEEKTVVHSEKDLSGEIDFITDLSGLDDSYILTSSNEFDEDYWELTWIKQCDNGVLNPYDGVNLVVNRHTKEIVVYKRFDEAPNTLNPKISQVNAKSSIVSLLEAMAVNDNDLTCELAFVKANYDVVTDSLIPSYGDVRLSYLFQFNDGGYSVYVDAVTGEPITYSELKDTARAFSISGQAAFPSPAVQTKSATDCFKALGYSTFTPYYSATSQLKSEVKTFIARSDAYGFYLACHGNKAQTTLSNNTWPMGRSDFYGNWKFVFIDACYSADGTGWASCFNINNSSTKRAFLGWFNTVDGQYATEFTSAFFPEVVNRKHSNNIRDAAVWAAAQVQGAGTTPIRFYGDKTYNGRL